MFGFPVGFNRQCKLEHVKENHKSAKDFPRKVDTFLEEEIKLGAKMGPFKSKTIPNSHSSPFMTRPKPDFDTRRVIVNLSWPIGNSINDGVENIAYMGSEFKLNFPSIDDLTSNLIKLGKGAHIFKIDVSRAFRHLPMDSFDSVLLGLSWKEVAYVDTRLPFGSRHGSQLFQRTSDAVRYIMRHRGYNVLNYIDDFLGFGMPHNAKASFGELYDVMSQLGLTISKKKLVPPTTRAVVVDTVGGTLAIPQKKTRQYQKLSPGMGSKN